MKIIEYNDCNNIIVEFQDKYKTKTHAQYCNFVSGSIKNPYYPSIYGVGVVGNKYPRTINCKNIKEYDTWIHMLQRCFDDKLKKKQPAYNDVTCCEKWLNYENFYEWIHSQENFDKWVTNDRWALDKDILIKGSKTYSPETCCLVPQNVNCLFLNRKALRGDLPIGVRQNGKKFEANYANALTGGRETLGKYTTPEEAFLVYKSHKEKLIKQIAEIEYKVGNIAKRCYDAMMNYKVEIND